MNALNYQQLQALNTMRIELDSLLVEQKDGMKGLLSDAIDDIAARVVNSAPTSVVSIMTTITTVGITVILEKRRLRKRREAYRRVVTREIRDLFDVTKEYEMDSGSAINHVHNVGIENPTTDELEAMYRAVWDHLQGGKLRELCNQRGLVRVADYNIPIVRQSWMTWQFPPPGTMV